jgi:hypothetical protein
MTKPGALLIACFVLSLPVCFAQAGMDPSTQPAGDALQKGGEAMQAGKFVVFGRRQGKSRRR